MWYHKKKIPEWIYWEISKITEEYEEFIDAVEQKSKLLELVELSDMIWAIDWYVNKKYNMNIDDLITMAKLTHNSFKDGSRKSKN